MAATKIIQFEGDNATLIWKSPIEDFDSKMQLIVHESQEAIFFANGQALDLFGPGRHTLETENIPLVKRFFAKITGDGMPFHCEVYFINTVEQLPVKWGTDSKVEYTDPVFGFPLKIGVSGEMSLRVCDSRKLLLKLVGTKAMFGQNDLVGYFRAFLNANIKPYIAQAMVAQQTSIFDIDSRLKQFSDELKGRLMPDFEEYGLTLSRFFVTTVVKPESDRQYESFKELHFRKYADVADAKIKQEVGIINQRTEAERTIIKAQGIAGKRAMEGYTYQEERRFDVAEKAAGNEGAGVFGSAGVGLGMMGGVGAGVGAAVAGLAKDAMSTAAVQDAAVAACSHCGARLQGHAVYCPKCGAKAGRAAMVHCGSCGAGMDPEDTFCSKCGGKVEQKNEKGD